MRNPDDNFIGFISVRGAREHNLQNVDLDMRVVSRSDWVIDIGPGAGDEGGRIVTIGTPTDVSRAAASRTAPYLARFMA
ncbi:MAG TPA: hypothetical protein VN602_03675 [Gemmatimonadaceae bacterium]|nr:hypothetical protein [Gemmatimonadaceae bacterium]